MPTVKIPGAWTPSTEGRSSLTVPGDTVGQVLDQLTALHPDLRKRIFAGDRIASWTNVYVDEDDVRDTGGLDTVLPPGATVTIVPALAGG
ncbi:MoaD/ThiS family protein [Streptomyces acidiscabies]|uniref:MoaD/ThiS family protein n=1 Tax=Streptomyces acidiscabies TaxID=42234 RepID=UPI0009529553|nr:MoaD/ThiS family protein [Streptomyces acidiscabies]